MQEFFDTVFTDRFAESLTVGTALIQLFSALFLGLLISLTYIYTSKKSGYLPSFAVTLVILPAISATVIIIICKSILLALGIAGTFSMVRFRTTFSSPKDTACVFFSLTSGIVAGTGYTYYALAFVVIVNLAMIILYLTHYAESKSTMALLRLNTKEDFDYENSLKPIFDEFTVSALLKRITQGAGRCV